MKNMVFVMMKISLRNSINYFLQSSLIKTNKKRRFSALDYKIIRPFKIKTSKKCISTV
jgi:hypothetical protein